MRHWRTIIYKKIS